MRKRIVAGNWKMNTSLHEGYQLMKDIVSEVKDNDLENCEIMIFPPHIHLKTFENTMNGSGIVLGAQNCHYEQSGAYTGEISVPMLKSIPVHAVLIGHSERRTYFNETDETVNLKVKAAIEGELRAVMCCGETLGEREANNHFDVIERQIREGLRGIAIEDMSSVIVAYEPVWAIGTGVTASDDQAQEMHAFIRELISSIFGEEVAAKIQILYGGSMKPGNAQGLLSQTDIDGGLIGGASLKPEQFLKIVRA